MDEIRLTLPGTRPFLGIVNLVLGGFAVRHDLTLEDLEDLQLALAGVLDRSDVGDEVTVSFRIDQEVILASAGPFQGEGLRAELERAPDRDLSLRRLLDTVVDGVELSEREGLLWVELRKNVRLRTGAV